MSFRVFVSGVAVECDTPKEALALVNELRPGPPTKQEQRPPIPFIREAPPAREQKEEGPETLEALPKGDDVARYV